MSATVVIDILRREKFFLTEQKLNFLCEEVKILGGVVDDDGICMDMDKVDALIHWKTLTNQDLLPILSIPPLILAGIDRNLTGIDRDYPYLGYILLFYLKQMFWNWGIDQKSIIFKIFY